jgi:glycosyltransferase involved in cell wall biosynthesis
MRICIVIPASDSIATLAAAVDSALNQNYADSVIYVSDNASADGTKEYLASNYLARIVGRSHAERVSKTQNWNRAFDSAPECDIFVMLHSDDVLYPTALQAIARVFRRHPGTALVFGNHDVLSLDGSKVTWKKMWPLPYVARDRSFDRLQTLNSAASIVGCAFPRTLYKRNGGFPAQYDFYQDMEFFHQLGKLGPARYIPAKLGLYRVTPSRPRSRLRFYCEEITWLSSMAGTWSASLDKKIKISWISGACAHLRRENPDLLHEYEKHLEQTGFSIHLLDSKQRVLPRILMHTCYKFWLSVISLFRN